jgi:hypothetical protein
MTVLLQGRHCQGTRIEYISDNTTIGNDEAAQAMSSLEWDAAKIQANVGEYPEGPEMRAWRDGEGLDQHIPEGAGEDHGEGQGNSGGDHGGELAHQAASEGQSRGSGEGDKMDRSQVVGDGEGAKAGEEVSRDEGEDSESEGEGEEERDLATDQAIAELVRDGSEFVRNRFRNLFGLYLRLLSYIVCQSKSR